MLGAPLYNKGDFVVLNIWNSVSITRNRWEILEVILPNQNNNNTNETQYVVEDYREVRKTVKESDISRKTIVLRFCSKSFFAIIK